MHVPQTEIILHQDGVELARQTVPPGEYVIGRLRDEVDIFADTPQVSRRHALLTVNYDQLLLEDLGSTHGTFVGGQRIAEPTRLYPNQEIRLGDVTLEVHRQRASSSPDVSLAPAQAALRRFLPDEVLAEKRYAIGSQIARGGMGAVLDARQEALQRTVAMKVMLDTSGEGDVLRFIDEAQITGQLEHPNIVPIHDIGIDEQDQLFYTMKLVRGVTLKKILELLAAGVEATVKKYPLATLLTVFQKACDAVAFAHSRSVIHRDLKPENLMIGDFGEVYVMDWGLAKVIGRPEAPAGMGRSIVRSARAAAEPELGSTMAGTVMGTPQYLSPEQARGETESLDGRSDVYALGAILFELLHLRASVNGATVEEVVEKVARGVVEWGAKPSAIPDSLLAICRKALTLDRDQRYRRVADLQADLTAYQNGFATSAEKAGTWKQVRLFVRRHKTATAGVAAVLLVGLTLGTRAVVEGRRAEQALADLQKQAPALRQLAENEAGVQKYDAALEKLGLAMTLDPSHLPAYWRRALFLLGGEQYSECVKAFRLAREKDPPNAETLGAILPTIEKLAAAPPAERWTTEHSLAVRRYLDRINALPISVGLSRYWQLEGEEQLKVVRQKVAAWLGPKHDMNISLTPSGMVQIDPPAHITTIEPLRGLPISAIIGGFPKAISSLEPLRGMPLRVLTVGRDSSITDLKPLKGAPLIKLNISVSKVRSLEGLEGAPLEDLEMDRCGIADLSPLRGAPLRRLSAQGNGIRDLSPLAGAPLDHLLLPGNPVSDLSPLRGAPLQILNISGGLSPYDLSPLRGLPLEHVTIGNSTDLRPLLTLTKVRFLHFSAAARAVAVLREHPAKPAIRADCVPATRTASLPFDEFWKAFDKLPADTKK